MRLQNHRRRQGVCECPRWGSRRIPFGIGVKNMTRAAIAEMRVFESWQDYQEALKRAIAPLTEEQLQRRLLPSLRTPGEIAAHIVFGRVLHLQRTLGGQAAELSPLLRWDDDD